MSQQMTSVVTTISRGKGKLFRAATNEDEDTFAKAEKALAAAKGRYGEEIIPHEKLPPIGTLGFRVNNYGMRKWGDLYSARQLLALTTFVRNVRDASGAMTQAAGNDEYPEAVVAVLSLLVSKLTDWLSVLVSWQPHVQCPGHVFTRQALPMVWDYTESVPVTGSSGSWESLLRVLCAGWTPLETVRQTRQCTPSRFTSSQGAIHSETVRQGTIQLSNQPHNSVLRKALQLQELAAACDPIRGQAKQRATRLELVTFSLEEQFAFRGRNRRSPFLAAV